MRGACVGLIEGLQVEHFLVGRGGFRQLPLLHECVAKQAIVQDERATGDQGAGDLLSLTKTVELMQNVSAQEKGVGLPGVP